MRALTLAALLFPFLHTALIGAEKDRMSEAAALRARVESTREESEIKAEVRKADQKELVRPAPKGFKPEDVRRKVRVTLVPRETTIKVGESFWYRLELQNVGKESIEYHESPSFLKDGLRWDMLKWGFEVILPDGSREKMILGRYYEERNLDHRPRRPIDVPDSKNLTETEARTWARRDSLRRNAQRDFHVTLRPGESIITKPWRWVYDEEYLERFRRNEPILWPVPEGTFRELRTVFRFKTPGKYKVVGILRDPPPSPPDEEFLLKMERRGFSRNSILGDHDRYVSRALGHVESNWVTLEVKP
ncbi:MAG: hypothetical protein FD126_1873 [Elusimicrobia bacterium]|nr:MAG: hypothetical protein FD126_1873 [Elusimicrobiota bacterium]